MNWRSRSWLTSSPQSNHDRSPRRQIIEISARHFGFSVDELIGPSRRRPLVIARQIAMYLFRELTDFSYPAIGREFGDRDHTTVIHAVEKISALMKERGRSTTRSQNSVSRSRTVYDLWITLLQQGMTCLLIPKHRHDADCGLCDRGITLPSVKPPQQEKPGLSTIPRTYYSCCLFSSNSKGVEHSVKFRADRDTLLETLVTASRATSTRSGPSFGIVGTKLHLTRATAGSMRIRSRSRDRSSLRSRRRCRWTVLVPSRLVVDIVRSFEPGAVTVVAGDEEVRFSSGRAEFS